jgi:hypothetical protein
MGEERDVAAITRWTRSPPKDRQLGARFRQDGDTRACRISPGKICGRDVHAQRQQIRVGGIKIGALQECVFIMISRDAPHPAWCDLPGILGQELSRSRRPDLGDLARYALINIRPGKIKGGLRILQPPALFYGKCLQVAAGQIPLISDAGLIGN